MTARRRARGHGGGRRDRGGRRGHRRDRRAGGAPTDRGPRISAGWSTGLRWLVAVLAGLILFSAFVLANGADPIAVYSDIWTSTLTQSGQFQQIILRAAPSRSPASRWSCPPARGW